MARMKSPRHTRSYYDNLIRFRFERIIQLFGEHPEQRLVDVMNVLGVDRSAAHKFLKELVERKFLVHEHGGKYILPSMREDDVVCVALDWLHTEPKLFFCGYREGAIFGWWAVTDKIEDEPKEWFGSYLRWGATAVVPGPQMEVLPWSQKLGLAIRRVTRLFSRVNRSRRGGARP